MVTKMRYRKGNLIPFHSASERAERLHSIGRIRVLTRDAKHDWGPATPTHPGQRGAQH